MNSLSMLRRPSRRRFEAMRTGASFARVLLLLLAVLTLAGPAVSWARAQAIEWVQRVPVARIGHAMAFDAARGVTVLFGGRNGSGGVNAETWEWNGSIWTQGFVSGPSARYGHTMSYDVARGVTVLFGGYNNTSTGFSAETWEWNGTAWSQRAGSGPTARYGHAMTYDMAREVAVMFGGSSTAKNAETWELRKVCSADFNHDGAADFADYDAFVTCFEGLACPPGTAADFDHDGTVDFFDYDAFVVAFETPC